MASPIYTVVKNYSGGNLSNFNQDPIFSSLNKDDRSSQRLHIVVTHSIIATYFKYKKMFFFLLCVHAAGNHKDR